MADSKGYMKGLGKKIKIWRWLADAAIFLAAVFALVPAVPFALAPMWLFSTSQIKPVGGSRTMAWIVLAITIVLLLVILRQRFQFTRDSLRSEQKVELWGGATGLFVLFTMGNHVTDEARNGLLGALGLIFFLAAAVLLEPLALELKERAESEEEKREEMRHRDLLGALSAVKGAPPAPPTPSATGRGRRLLGIRLGRRC